MNQIVTDLLGVVPEIFLLGLISIILIVDLFVRDESRGATYMLSVMALLSTALLVLNNMDGHQNARLFADSIVVDQLSAILKIAILLSVSVVFVYAKEYLIERNIYKGEFFTLGLFATMGMMIMISSANFLTLYLGLELLSLSMYAMVAIQRDCATASEAAMKYFVLGAIASGMLLYGMSILYGVTGSLDFIQINQALANTNNKLAISFGLVFIILAIAFKLGAVPFHMWMPDVYHGAPTAITLFIASAPKIAGFAMLYRLMVDGMSSIMADWQAIFIILSVASMFVGNIIAIAQDNIKRMFAYSTISHVGFIIMGVLTGTQNGYAAAMFYTLSYVIMSLLGFGMILVLSRAGFEADNISDFKGLNQKNPWYALLMMLALFSMAGIPPLLGFWAKIAVLQEAINVGLVWLAVAGVAASIIGAYYYLRVVKVIYFDQPQDEIPVQTGQNMQLLISSNGLLVLGLGIYPAALLNLCAGIFH